MKRWSQAERTTAIATLVLLISLFLPWYTYNFGLGSVSVDGLWHGWMYIVLLLSLAILVYWFRAQASVKCRSRCRFQAINFCWVDQ